MYRWIALLVLACSLGAQAQEDTLNRVDPQGRKTGYWVYFRSEGRKVYEGVFKEGHPVGRFIRYHPDGQVSANLFYDSTGTRVDAEIFDTTGRLLATGTYLNQRKEGEWVFLSEHNLPLFRINYQNGLIHGDAWRYDVDGKPVEKTQWKFSTLDGVQIIFAPEGYIQASIQYRKGQTDGPYKIFHPDGSDEVSGQYEGGIKTGDWTYYRDDGSVDYVLHYRKGKLLNPEILDARQQESFKRYEKNRNMLKDPEDFLHHPEDLIGR